MTCKTEPIRASSVSDRCYFGRCRAWRQSYKTGQPLTLLFVDCYFQLYREPGMILLTDTALR